MFGVPMAKKRMKLGEILVEWGVIEESALTDVLQYGMEHSKRIGEALVEMALCTEEDVTKALAAQFGLEYIDFDKRSVDQDSYSPSRRPAAPD